MACSPTRGYPFSARYIHEWLPVPNAGGSGPLWEEGALLYDHTMTWLRVRAWRDSLPPEVIETAQRCRKPDGDIAYVNSPEAREWRRKAVDMAIEASREHQELTLFEVPT